MEKQYSLFYSYRKLDDIFAIVFHGYGKVTKRIRNKNVECLYSEDNVCGYNIYNIKDIVKIKAKGLIYLPNKELIDLINSILVNAGFETIPYILHSGFLIGKVVDSNHIDIGGFIINIQESIHLNKNSLVVVAMPGTMLPNEELVENGHVCTYKDLSISEDENVLVLEDEYEIGSDFFSMGEK